ncbi:hypothetical protein GCM10018777_56520 [Streptomyces albogriseolus]|uniref:hypothetical protein n=1 Tax=Streptomyces TaxID=1883 RepID=UPI00167650F2|nr:MULTISPECIES: hypothetical protein [Streptomyces]GHB15611.1 hypothetical protein GCM10010330_81080 [Streptomyces tendae]GHG33154.1 hypothetical protein GCM10018777_56520 [Streptomyces viridodiastaticus]
MTETTHHNGQIPTDPTTTLTLLLALTVVAKILTPEEAATLAALAPLALHALPNGRR